MGAVTPNIPIDVPTSATVSFIESHLSGAGEILEIGCGSGHVAAELSMRGYKVVGIESDDEAATQARLLGVEVVNGLWPEVDVENVSTVVFTRSLHHISPLAKAIAKVREVLVPCGMVLVEDFTFSEADPAAIRWFVKILGSRKAQALISSSSDAFVTTLLDSDDAVMAWHKDHDHDLHTVIEMTEAIREQFEIQDTQSVPYLYRYLVEVLPQNPEAAAFLKEVYSEESRLGKNGAFSLIGDRIAAVIP